MRSSPWRRAVAISVIGLLISGLVGVLFAEWLRATGDWSAGLPWERALLLSIDRTVPIWIDWVMLALPWIGTNLTLLPILAVVALWLWRKKGRGELALELMIVVLGSLIMNAALKDLFDRPRPELWEHRGQFKWAAYPSGHAIVGIAVYFTICNMLRRERGWWWPYLVSAALLTVNLYSRLYLGVHWPSDVLGGLLLGVVWLMVVEYAFAPFHGRESPIPGTELPRPSFLARVTGSDSP